MYAPAIALAWEVWRRHRLGLAGVAALVLGFAAVAAADPFPENMAAVHSLWFTMGLCYVIGVFAYGFEGRLEAAESGFPARLFVLPVRTAVLVGWPMLQGVATAVVLWVAWDRLVLRPSGVETPGWWAVMLAAIVATSQALVWLPFGLPWLRLLVTVPVLLALARSPFLLALLGDRFADSDTQATVLGWFAATLVPIAYLVAWAGVTLARRGDGANWLAAVRPGRRVGAVRREGGPFGSAMRAQVWYEWRLRGRVFVLFVVFVVAGLVALGALTVRTDDQRTGFGGVFPAIPALLAAFWGTSMGSSGETRRMRGGLSAFNATRPLGNWALVMARVWAAALAAAGGWAVVAVVMLGWYLLTGTIRNVPLVWDALADNLGPTRAGVVCALAVVLPVLVSWRMIVVNLWVGLTGRAWVMIGQFVVTGTIGLRLMEEWVRWKMDPARYDGLVEALPWLMGGAVVLKLLAAAWAVRALLCRGEVAAETVVRLLGLWLAGAAALFGLLVWLVPEGVVRTYQLALGVVLFLPVTRIAVAPLALAWNRHR